MDTFDTQHPIANAAQEHAALSVPDSSVPASATDTARSTPSHEVSTSPAKQKRQARQTFLLTWWSAIQTILPIYVAVHLAFFVTTSLSFLFTHKDFDGSSVPISYLWNAWHHWDTGHYMFIAQHGYDVAWRTAFFPLYPLLERGLLLFHIIHNPLIAGLIISDVAGFGMLVVLYQLVKEDFDEHGTGIALRTVLYLSLFPTAFFLAAGYNESLFICLALLSFYNMRHGNWWLAGLFGLFASLSRSVGLFLFLPFCYEYLYQRRFQLKAIRLSVVGGALIPAGTALYSLYCYYRFHDFLAFSHAQAHWQHHLEPPWYGILASIHAIQTSSGVLGFQSLRNLLDLVPDLLVLVIVALMFVGPWRFPRSKWSYALYAALLIVFLQLFPVGGTGLFPLQSVSRYLLEIFPAFIILATWGKSRMFNMNYLMISGAILFFLLTQFLTGHWVL